MQLGGGGWGVGGGGALLSWEKTEARRVKKTQPHLSGEGQSSLPQPWEKNKLVG